MVREKKKNNKVEKETISKKKNLSMWFITYKFHGHFPLETEHPNDRIVFQNMNE